MSHHHTLIIKETHRGLLYEDGLLRDVLPAGRYQIPQPPSKLAEFFGAKGPRVEVVLVDIRGRDRTIVVPELLTADGATISASFVVQFRVEDPRAAIHQVKNFEERLYTEAQTAARRVLRGLSVEEVMASRDEIGEEILLQLQESCPSYGLAVSGIDFKDLIVPEDLRKIMNRAVYVRRLRQVQLAEGRLIDDQEAIEEGPFASSINIPRSEAGADSDDLDFMMAKASFGCEPWAAARAEGFAIRRDAFPPRKQSPYANASSGNDRRRTRP